MARLGCVYHGGNQFLRVLSSFSNLSMVSNYLLENRRPGIRVFDAASQPFYRSICSLSYKEKSTYSLATSIRFDRVCYIRFFKESGFSGKVVYFSIFRII